MIRLAVIACLVGSALSNDLLLANDKKEWYKNSVIYQIYPRSFRDSNDDGIGDLNGITSRLAYLADIGVTALWLSPIYKSPQADFGYDISDFKDIDPNYGTLTDFDWLVSTAKKLGLKVILDFVPNHSSSEHQWFKKSVKRIKPFDQYYVWKDAKMINGTRHPPNNWLSAFEGSAWKWNEDRQQYYLHQFVAGQPDLNYRSKALKQEMENVFTFWMNRGVDGFRIDAVNFLLEDSRFQDEPKSNVPGIPDTDYDSLLHVYSKDQDDTYDILKSWRRLMDNHANKTKSNAKMILTEAYTTHNLTIKYYTAGSNVPFNFMFMQELTKKSTAADFKKMIDQWVNSLPGPQYEGNWVVGNHDNHRVGTRFGEERADQITMLSLMLPGVAIIYNGDEIGMLDRNFTYQETVDPAGCNAGPNRYYLKSRDPERTPFQWQNAVAGGFSDVNKTWLPVNSNYKTLNLAAQKRAKVSHYKVFTDLVALKKKPILAEGSLEVTLVNNRVLAVVRRVEQGVAFLLINFSNFPLTVNAKTKLKLPEELTIYTASIGSNLPIGSHVDPTKLRLPAAASVVYTSPILTIQNLWCFKIKVCS
ncbi:alpha-glucosidase-like [Colletes gigas]|uniref:alpha-glucosidase-like n=1 Tax=Colletes gigas TaxID=935657 RepID=UPI001C9A7869|nr:alpha-glucosidase-like [Colletes gigas]